MTEAAKARWRDRAIVGLQLRWNTQPPTDEERSSARGRVHERYLRRLRRRRVWRRRAHSIDAQKWPLPLLRWLAVFGLALAWWAKGARTGPPHYWVPFAVIAGALTLPDIAGFAVGGFRLDLKQAEDQIAKLRQDVNAQARANANASVGPIIFAQDFREGMAAYEKVLAADQGPQEPYVPRHLDSDGTPEVP